MNNIYSVGPQFAATASDFFKSARQVAGDMAGRVVYAFNNLSQQMQKDRNVAIGVILTANAICFTIVHSLANYLNSGAAADAADQSENSKKFKNILFDTLLVGGSHLTLNVLLSKATGFALNRYVLAGITTAAIALRYLLRTAAETPAPVEEEKDNKEPVEKDAVKDINKLQQQALNAGAAAKVAATEEEAAKKAQVEADKKHKDAEKAVKDKEDVLKKLKDEKAAENNIKKVEAEIEAAKKVAKTTSDALEKANKALTAAENNTVEKQAADAKANAELKAAQEEAKKKAEEEEAKKKAAAKDQPAPAPSPAKAQPAPAPAPAKDQPAPAPAPAKAQPAPAPAPAKAQPAPAPAPAKDQPAPAPSPAKDQPAPAPAKGQPEAPKPAAPKAKAEPEAPKPATPKAKAEPEAPKPAAPKAKAEPEAPKPATPKAKAEPEAPKDGGIVGAKEEAKEEIKGAKEEAKEKIKGAKEEAKEEIEVAKEEAIHGAKAETTLTPDEVIKKTNLTLGREQIVQKLQGSINANQANPAGYILANLSEKNDTRKIMSQLTAVNPTIFTSCKNDYERLIAAKDFLTTKI